MEERIVSTSRTQTSFDTQLVTGVITVEYETREATAKKNRDFIHTTGTLVIINNRVLQKILLRFFTKA